MSLTELKPKLIMARFWVDPDDAIANQANLTREELDDLEYRAIFIHDQRKRNAIKKEERLGL